MPTKTSSRWQKYVIGGLIGGWYAYIGVSTWPAKVISRYVHGWVPILVLATLLVILPVLKWKADAAGVITGLKRILVISYVAVCFVLLPISSVVHPLVTFFGAGLFLLELWLLTRRWTTNVAAGPSQTTSDR